MGVGGSGVTRLRDLGFQVPDTASARSLGGNGGTKMKGNKPMLRVVLRIALGLLAIVAMQQVAAAQATSSTALLSVSASPPTLPNSVTTVAPIPTLVAQVPMAPAPGSCVGVSPYDNYSCLDAYLGDGFFERLYNYYKLEWGQAGPPSDPSAPSARRDD